MTPQPLEINHSFFLQFLLLPKFRIYRHVLFIGFTAMAFYNLDMNQVNHPEMYHKLAKISCVLLLFYLNMYWLVPQLLLRNKFMEYGGVVLILTGVTYLIARLLQHDGHGTSEQDARMGELQFFSFIFIFSILMAASAAVKLFQRWVTDNQRLADLEKITTQAELEQLKNQINPHFLFNMLNNANVLTKNDPAKASEVLLKLSNLLRYQLYDCARNKVMLMGDIGFLTDLLNLEKIRRDKFDMAILRNGDINDLLVPPLLFVAFVENAVKHSMDADNESYVHLYFNVSHGKLHFMCINSKPLLKPDGNAHSGLGLVNVKRRLELLYGSDHGFEIHENETMFKVSLTIKV